MRSVILTTKSEKASTVPVQENPSILTASDTTCQLNTGFLENLGATNDCNNSSNSNVIHLICELCWMTEVPPGFCEEAALYCEMITCDGCNRWFHEVCATGSVKVHRGMKFKCKDCQ